MTTDTTFRDWRPAPFKDPVLDFAMKTAFDNTAGLKAAAVQSTQNNVKIASGIEEVLGQRTELATGLSLVSTVVVSVSSSSAFGGETVSAVPSPTTKGAVNLYVWSGNIPSITKRRVAWIAFGA